MSRLRGFAMLGKRRGGLWDFSQLQIRFGLGNGGIKIDQVQTTDTDDVARTQSSVGDCCTVNFHSIRRRRSHFKRRLVPEDSTMHRPDIITRNADIVKRLLSNR